MKNPLLILFILGAVFMTNAQEFKIITVVESIVPMGLGRSRIIENQDITDFNNFTTERTDGTTSSQSKISRKSAKIDKLSETKLLNFYSGVGINFQNIASNDAIISSKINAMVKEGWTLTFVTSGVESVAGQADANGIFITRLFFSRS